MNEYRIDYIREDRTRGVWNFEMEFPDDDAARAHAAETLAYAIGRLADMSKLIAVRLTETDLD